MIYLLDDASLTKEGEGYWQELVELIYQEKNV